MTGDSANHRTPLIKSAGIGTQVIATRITCGMFKFHLGKLLGNLGRRIHITK